MIFGRKTLNSGSSTSSSASADANAKQMPLAFFIAGFGTFALIYDVQPLLPEFASDFHVSPATASLALSLTTLALSASMLAAGRLSELVNRRRLMSASILLGGVASVLCMFSENWTLFLVLRALLGIALGGLPAVALAYIADNAPPARLAHMVGLYVSGTAFGGMAGRLLGGVITNAAQDWRFTVAGIGILCLIAGVLFYLALPALDRRQPAPPDAPAHSLKNVARRFLLQWHDPILRSLFLEGALLLGCFVATFNYLCFRLAIAPYNFSHEQISLIFLLNFLGMVVSPLCGKVIAKHGLPATLRGAFCLTIAGCAISAFDTFPLLLAGSALVTTGFFVGHSTATAWVNQRAKDGRAIASAQYLTTYYIGASTLGWLGGWAWHYFSWHGVCIMVAATALLAIALIPKNPPPKKTRNRQTERCS